MAFWEELLQLYVVRRKDWRGIDQLGVCESKCETMVSWTETVWVEEERSGRDSEVCRREKQKDWVLDWMWVGLGEEKVWLMPRFLDGYQREGMSKGNWVSAVEGNMMGAGFCTY